jgi:Na+/proline symporter
MDKSVLAVTNGLSPLLGFATMIGLGAFLLILSFISKTALVRNTHDFIIADRKVGFGFGVGSVIAVWTWAMAVMMSSAMTYQWGLSGLFWFVVPNGFAVIAMIPFARILRRNMPQGYTISEFVKYRFAQSKVASGIVTLTMIFGILLEILINLKGTSVVISTVFSIDWKVAAIVGIICVLTYSYFGGLWTSVMTGTLNTLMVTVPAAIGRGRDRRRHRRRDGALHGRRRRRGLHADRHLHAGLLRGICRSGRSRIAAAWALLHAL